MATYYVPNETGWRESHGYYHYIRFKVDQTYSPSTNTSTLSITLQYTGPTGDHGINTGAYVKVNGTGMTPSPGGNLFRLNNANTWCNLAYSDYSQIPPYSCNVTHNADGTASVTFAVALSSGSNLSWENSATLQLSENTSYALAISTGAGAVATVTRNGTALSNGATIRYGDVLTITFGASTGYALASHTVNGSTFSSGGTHTVTGNVSVAATATQTASTIASSSSSVATQSAYSLTMTRYSTSYYHKATFKIGNTVLATSGAFAASLSYTVPRSWFTNYPTSTSLTVTVSVQTYTNSNCTTAVGSPVTTTVTVTADSGMKPTIGNGFAVAAANNSGTAASSISGYVQGYSKATVTLTKNKLTMAPGATVASYTVVCQGVTRTVSSPGATATATTDTLTGTNAISITVTVTDSRGRTESTSLSVTPMAYVKPTLSAITVFRCTQSGTANEDGAYYSAKATANRSSLGGQNSVTLTVKHKAATASSYGAATQLQSGTAQILGGALDADTSYIVMLTVEDSLHNTAEATVTLSTRKWSMKFRPDGEGVGFGKAPEHAKALEIPADWTLYNGTKKIRPEALNLGRADYIVYSGDFNNFTDVGTYGILGNSQAASMSNRPCDYAGLLKVYCSNGDGKKAGDTWFYVTQEYTSIYGGVYIRRGTSSSDPTISWGSWTQTPAESSTNYCKMADGTLIQWGEASDVTVSMTQSDALYVQRYTINLPIAFYNGRYYASASFQYSTGYGFACGVPYSGRTASSFAVDFMETTNRSGNKGRYIWFAVGRWKS